MMAATTNGSASNGSSSVGSGWEVEYVWPSLILLIIPTLTIFGNALVVLSILREKSLKTVTNYFIFSLAVADFLVALVVMPFAVFVEVSGSKWILGKDWCNVYIASDVCASTASIFNLLAISLDRYIAITQPIQYSRMGKSFSRAVVTISIVWTLSVLIAIPIIAGVNQNAGQQSCIFTNAVYIICSSCLSFFIPAFFMAFLYTIIFKTFAGRIVQRLRERAKAAMARKMKRTLKKNEQKPPIEDDPDKRTGGLKAYANAIFGGATLMKDIGSRMDAIASEMDTSTIGDLSTTEGLTPDYTTSDEDEDRVSMMSASHLDNKSPNKPKKNEQSHTNHQTPQQLNQIRLPSASDNPVNNHAIVEKLSPRMMMTIKGENGGGDDGQRLKQPPRTEPTRTRSFGETVEQIPFIDSHNSSNPNSAKDESGAGGVRQRSKSETTVVTSSRNDDSGKTDDLSAAENQKTTTQGTMNLITPSTGRHSTTCFNAHNSNNYNSSHRRDNVDDGMTIELSPMIPANNSAAAVSGRGGVTGPTTGEEQGTTEINLFPYHRSQQPGRGTDLSLRRRLFMSLQERPNTAISVRLRNAKKSFQQTVSAAFPFVRTTTIKLPGKHKSRSLAKKEHRQIRREQKATQTLAVVLMVFLICWVPFFTCHIWNSICILAFDGECIGFKILFFATWLGYMNSFMNPIIYTIFNPEYRKAFRRIIIPWKS